MYAVEITVSITASGINTAGETYSLECSATVSGSTGQPTITWLDSMNNPVSSEMFATTGSMSTLTFNPLAASHTGNYTCRAALGYVMQSAARNVIVLSECCLMQVYLTLLVIVSVQTNASYP